MQYGLLKPMIIKIVKSRLRYRKWGLPLMKPLRVIGCDMKKLLITDERVVNVYPVSWKDIQLVTTEVVTQISVLQSDNSKVVIKKQRERKSLFDKGKPKEGTT